MYKYGKIERKKNETELELISRLKDSEIKEVNVMNRISTYRKVDIIKLEFIKSGQK